MSDKKIVEEKPVADNSASSNCPIHGLNSMQTRKWDDTVLPLLRIGIVEEAHRPYEVFPKPMMISDGSSSEFGKYRSILRKTTTITTTNLCLTFMSPDTDYKTVEHKIKIECVKHVFNSLLNFDFEHIQDASQQKICDLYAKIKGLQESDLLEGVPEINPTHYIRIFPSIKWTCMRYEDL